MPHTLLLADDSVTIRRVIELTFTDESVRVVSVSNGRAAIERIDSPADRPDIVLADIGMADVSGYDIAAHIKGRPDLRHIPVVLLAGAFEPLDEARARQAGSDGVLVKPFEPQMVVARVRELLGRQTPSGSQAQAGAHAIAPAPPRAREDARPAPQAPPPVVTPRRLDTLDPAPPRAASSSAAPGDPLSDESLDRLDAAFADTRTAALDEAVVSDFAEDLKALRSSQPAASPEVDEFGDWDLPSRTAAPSAEPQGSDAWQEPVRPPVVEAPPPPPVLPPPVTLEPRPAAAAPSHAAAPLPRPVPPAAARPTGAAPLADAFSSLLAAEEGRPPQGFLGAAYGPAVSASSATLSDDEIERIVDRVIVKLGANVRGTVIDLAESLVRAEIDRLKALR